MMEEIHLQESIRRMTVSIEGDGNVIFPCQVQERSQIVIHSRASADSDIERQHEQTQTFSDQSHQLSTFVRKKTESHGYDPVQPDPPEELQLDKQMTGFAYWTREVCSARDHGGDYKERFHTAFRTALGSFLTFSVLALPHQNIFGCVWIGNIFMHSNIKDSFGASLTESMGFGRSVILTTVATWPITYGLSHLTTAQASLLLPFLTFILSFFIMVCPQLTSRNLMILVMYIILASPVRAEIAWWEPFGWLATYLISLLIAILMNIFPIPNFALQSTHGLLERLEKDFAMLILQCNVYTENAGAHSAKAKSAIASIEMMHSRTTRTIDSLKGKLPATKTELYLLCKSKAAQDLEEWVQQCDRLIKPLKMLRSALMQRVIGEDNGQDVVQAKQIIREQLGPEKDRLTAAMIAAIAACHALADPSQDRVLLPDVTGELKVALQECQEAFHRAMRMASEQLDPHSPENVPVFAHLTRRMASFSALFDLADSLLGHLSKHSSKGEETVKKASNKGFLSRLNSWASSMVEFLQKEWLWHDEDSFRLALKTSVGMIMSSLFISVPYLWNISQPFGVWPGLTVASVNLTTTGSSFHKATDRLFGTLLAAAYALLATDLFPGNSHFVKIPLITVFTFVLVYMRNEDHAYKYTYAATSIGSMLYGSIKNNFNILGYIPKRIELIFCGVMIFSIVELMIFPRSSRKIVEESTFEFFDSMRDFLRQATDSMKQMGMYISESSSQHRSTSGHLSLLLSEDSHDPFHLQKLKLCLGNITAKTKITNQELDSALEEPNIGVSLPLDAHSLRGLLRNQSNCEMQASLIFNAFEALSEYYKQEDHPIREMNWPQIHAEILQDASLSFDCIWAWLTTVYPDGRIRPQTGNSIKAVSAASSFRTLEDCRLRIISKWAWSYHRFIHGQGFDLSDPVAIMTLGITTSCILELCRHLQKAGKHVEEMAYLFPPEE